MKEQDKDFPFDIKISFKSVIDAYEKRAKTEAKEIERNYLKSILAYAEDFPKLVDGINSEEELEDHREPIQLLLNDLFPKVLTNNEIKAATIPLSDIIFNSSKRLQQILADAGGGFKLKIRNLNTGFDYVYGCILILNTYYGYGIDFTRPLYLDIPNEEGIVKHYRISLNIDLVSFEPTDKAVDITPEDVDALIQNMDNVDFWKEKFPPMSWIFKGFMIMNLTDVTVDDDISDLKAQLLDNNILKGDSVKSLRAIFRSIYKIPDLRVGFTIFQRNDVDFVKMNNGEIKSYILDDTHKADCQGILCQPAFQALVKEQHYFAIPNVETYAEKSNHDQLSQNLLKKGVKSCILSPIAKNGELLAILELVSYRKNELNTINAIKLEDINPYIYTAVERNRVEFENRVKAVIQNECTSIHPSVLWVFEKEAKQYIYDLDHDGMASFRDISFQEVYPLYGQIDIVGSSEERNRAIQKDLLLQLNSIIRIIDVAGKIEALPIYEQMKYRISAFISDLEESLNASIEQRIINFIIKEIDPLFKHLESLSEEIKGMVQSYYESIDPVVGVVYKARKSYEETVERINCNLSRYIDRKQAGAQKIYPHYFERYKTDGVDHNIYIGGSLTEHKAFNDVYLFNLRLWQLQVMCEMENKFYELQKDMPVQLDAASLILAFNSTLSIRYRVDEKKFDVDGTYNARYEVIKKRIDKARIKDSEERVTQKGKIAIVYSQSSDQKEYMRYIKYLQAKNYLGEEVEILELEDVQGVVGLHAIRVEVLYHKNNLEDDENDVGRFTYQEMMAELN